MKKEKQKCKQCNTKLKTKYHYRGCSYIDNLGTQKEVDFNYCPKCGIVYYFEEE